MIVSQVAECGGRKVAVRTQLKNNFVAKFGKFGVAIVTTNRIAGIGGVLYKGKDGVE